MSSLRKSSKNSGYSECLAHTGPECLHSFKMGIFGNKDLLHKTHTLAHTLEGKNTCQNPGNIFNNFSIILGRLKAKGGGTLSFAVSQTHYFEQDPSKSAWL